MDLVDGAARFDLLAGLVALRHLKLDVAVGDPGDRLGADSGDRPLLQGRVPPPTSISTSAWPSSPSLMSLTEPAGTPATETLLPLTSWLAFSNSPVTL